MFITDDVKYIGVNDHKIDLFEGMYKVEKGMAYNSYVILDEKTAVFDTVDKEFADEWLDNLQAALNGRKPDYLIVQHMEPDHSANIDKFSKIFPEAIIVASQKAFVMMKNFFGNDFAGRNLAVSDGDTLSLGKHTLKFFAAPMVHWPEVTVTYDAYDKILFSADGFGKFGALDVDDEWACEARRYYFGIVGKYGAQVQALLRKASSLDIKIICPLHGPVLKENLSYYLNLYNTWSSYGAEADGIFIAYTSVYGHTKKAVEFLADKLKEYGCPKTVVTDLARSDMSEAVEDAFKYGKIVLATTTYNGEIFPFMRDFILHLTERNFKNRTVAFVENGSWAPVAAKIMKAMLENCQNITYTENNVKILSAMNDVNREEINNLAKELCEGYTPVPRPENNPASLFKIGYGLYVVTSYDGHKHNGLIVNAVSQVTNAPNKVMVTINKDNYSHHIIKKTGKMNLNCLTVETPFEIFKNFGFRTGRTSDKFENAPHFCSENGLAVLHQYINSYMSLKVENYIDLGSHGMFICSVEESKLISDKETMTYAYYQSHVKPKPQTTVKKGYVCKICGYIYEGDPLPSDFICPVCKHGAADFEPIK